MSQDLEKFIEMLFTFHEAVVVLELIYHKNPQKKNHGIKDSLFGVELK